jgi:group II intron reverse transcriptase/maturase
MQTSLWGIAEKASSQKEHRFGNLYEMLNEGFLKECFREINKNAAYGVDKVSAREYEKNLEENVADLVERLKRKSYRAKLVRRQYIPKGDGRMRPLGIPAIEDKLVQLAVAKILGAIYEPDFLGSSFGYRPGIGPQDAVRELTIKLQFGRYNYVVEADIKGFFDHIDHEWMMRMLSERIEDQALLRLIKKWLKAGVLDTDGQVIHPETGTPQGGIISPILANVYLHYALDLWFVKVIKKRCRGEACLIRYADDFVSAFEYQEEAEAFYQELGERLGKFKLELSAEKTRIIEFKRQQSQTYFEFLGFEFRWGKDRKGRAHLKRRTSRKRLKRSLERFTEWCKESRNLRVKQLGKQLRAKFEGYYNYYGVKGNSERLQEYYEEAMEILKKWLNRRSQRRSYNWQGFKDIIAYLKVPRPRITEGVKNREGASLLRFELYGV